jgi:murein DD-endopeptidase MepM/ murein hydrolase activator NlpD
MKHIQFKMIPILGMAVCFTALVSCSKTELAAKQEPEKKIESTEEIAALDVAAAAKVASPVPGYKVTYPYGVKDPRYAAGFHTGDDYAAPSGKPVVAVLAGTIVWSNSNGGAYGNWIGLRANGRDYVYCHLSSRSVSTGTKVTAGQQLGKVGATGNVTGPHLHFEDRPAGGGYGNVRKPKW